MKISADLTLTKKIKFRHISANNNEPNQGNSVCVTFTVVHRILFTSYATFYRRTVIISEKLFKKNRGTYGIKQIPHPFPRPSALHSSLSQVDRVVYCEWCVGISIGGALFFIILIVQTNEETASVIGQWNARTRHEIIFNQRSKKQEIRIQPLEQNTENSYDYRGELLNRKLHLHCNCRTRLK